MRTFILTTLTFFAAAAAYFQWAPVHGEDLSDSPPARRETIKTISGKEIVAEEFDRFLENHLEGYDIPGLSIAIINDARIVYHRALGVADRDTGEPVSEQTLFEAASLSKPLFAYFVMKQVEKGILDLDIPLYTYLPNPDIAFDERYRSITGRMVLAHTSGLPNWRSDNPDGKLDIAFTPGTDYRYSGEGYQYLKSALAHLLSTDDEGLDRLFQQEVVEPMRAGRLYFTWNEDVARHKAFGHRNGRPTNNGPQGNVRHFGAAHSLHTEAKSYARFLIAIMRREGLREESWAEMLSLHFRFPDEDESEQIARSLGFGIDSTAYGLRYMHGGNNGDFKAYAHFYKEHDYGVAVFCNSDNLFSSGFADELAEFLDE